MSRFRSLALAVAASLAGLAPAAAQERATLGLGRPALQSEINAWDVDVRPEGHGAPPGKGSVKDGERLYLEQCAACHGEFGEGAGRWPPLAGGMGSLAGDNPDKTIGSYWPYPETAFDYIRRAMPFGNAQSLADDDVYALTAFLLFMSDVVTADFVLSNANLGKVRLPNRAGFYDDDRETTERGFWGKEPCMRDCKASVTVLSRARMLDVTPEDEGKSSKVD